MTASTKVVSFGLNFNGQLGYECYDNKNPRSVNAPSDLISLHAGWNCSVAVNSNQIPLDFFNNSIMCISFSLIVAVGCTGIIIMINLNNININIFVVWGLDR